jgi:hypothetical protein
MTRYSSGTTREVPAEETVVPGLFVTPADSHPAFKPEWRLTHGPSGRALPYSGPTPGHVRSLARALASVRADWSDLPADPAEWPADFLAEVNRAGGEWECRRHRRPQPEFFWPVAATHA